MSCHKVDINIPSMSTLRRSVGGCALLGASLIACGVDTSNPNEAHIRKVPLSIMAASPETRAETGVATWELFKAKRTSINAERAFEVVARDAHDHVIHAMKVQMIRDASTEGPPPSTSIVPHMLIDDKGSVLESTLTLPALALHQKLGRDADLYAKTQEYGCVGDIFWAIGGFIVSIPTCAAVIPSLAVVPITPAAVAVCVGTVLAGPVAGVISAYEDCSAPDLPQGHVEVGILIEVEEDGDWEDEGDIWGY